MGAKTEKVKLKKSYKFANGTVIDILNMKQFVVMPNHRLHNIDETVNDFEKNSNLP